MRTLFEVEGLNLDDPAVLALGLEAMDRSLDCLEVTGSLAATAQALITPSIQVALGQALRDYREDVARSSIFQIRLPVQNPGAEFGPVQPGPQETPATTQRWSLTDGIWCKNPSSTLFKELARGDRENSPGGQGFPFLVVNRDEPNSTKDAPLQRFILSTDPMTGLHLRGLGRLLEEREQMKEDASGTKLHGGRERTEPGEGAPRLQRGLSVV
jgi:hypothetical protein